jgi:hypothetical protein|tara:strand:- start:171 stop:389 length:219 start_codon:yes stop_codon:yes gene_type:complete
MMTIREIISKLEYIENKLDKKSTQQEHELVGDLIDTIIADDLQLQNKPNLNESKILDTIFKMGIESGLIGQA